MLCAPLFSSTSQAAHPLSFTEAWITLSDRIEVRLHVFVDDLVRYQLPTKQQSEERLPESVTGIEFNQQIGSFSQQLPKRLLFFHAGQPLQCQIISEPDPWPESGSIDISANANQKLTWLLEFPLPQEPVTSLSLKHAFSPQGIDQPGELRLHSRHKTWKQRLDAVVPPHLMYTLIYSQHGKSITATTTANSVISRLIISRFAMTHEVTMPVDRALLAFRDAMPPEATQPDAMLPVVTQQILERQLKQWCDQNLLLQTPMENASAIPTSAVVEFFESGVIPEQPLPKRQAKELSLPGTLMGIRRTFPISHASESESLELKMPFPGTNEIRCETILNNKAQTFVQAVSLNTAQSWTLHEWHRNLEPNDAITIDHVSLKDLQPLIVSHISSWAIFTFAIFVFGGLSYVGSRSLLAAGCCNGCAKFGFWIFRISILCIVIRFAVGSSPEYEFRSQPTTTWLQAALHEIYAGIQQNSEQQTIKILSHWLHDDLVESTYLDLCQTMATESRQQTWTGISSVDLTEIASKDIRSLGDFSVACEWKVSGMAYHWGHAHQISHQYTGQFRLEQGDGVWKIGELNQLETISAATPSE